MIKKKKKRPFLKALLVLLCLTLPFMAWLGLSKRGVANLYKMDLERQKYVDRIKELKKENKELMEENSCKRVPDFPYLYRIAGHISKNLAAPSLDP